jgi:hypothetical protein
MPLLLLPPPPLLQQSQNLPPAPGKLRSCWRPQQLLQLRLQQAMRPPPQNLD